MSDVKKDLSIDNRYLNTLERMNGDIRLSSRPYHAQIETTTMCNLDCIMCSRQKYHGRGKHLDRNVLERLFEDLFPYLQNVLLSSFGEPLLYPHLDEMIESLRRFPKLSMGFYTNLLPLTEKKAEQIVKCGVSYLCVSIDGATKDTYEKIRYKGKWEQLIEKINMLNAFKKQYKSRTPGLYLVIVGMTANIRELPRFVDFAKQYGFEAVNISHNLYVDEESMEYLSLVHEKALANRMFREAYKRALQLGIRTNFNKRPYNIPISEEETGEIPVEKNYNYYKSRLYLEKILPVLKRFSNTWDFAGKSMRHFPGLFMRKLYRRYLSFHKKNYLGLHPNPNDAPPSQCGNPWTHVRVDVEGKVHPCCFIDDVMGDLRSENFEEIWNGPKYIALRKSIVERSFLPSCRKAACNWIRPGSSDVYGVEFINPPRHLTMLAKEEGSIRVRIKNSSAFWWLREPEDDAYLFNLSYKLFDKNGDCIMEGARAEMPVDVPPGNKVRVNLKIWSIPEPGEYELLLDMVHEGVTFFSERGNYGHKVKLLVKDFYRAEISEKEQIPERMIMQEALDLRFQVKNISGSDWPGTGKESVKLSYHWKDENNEYSLFEGSRSELPGNLSPGDAATVQLSIQAPGNPGDYTLEIDPVYEGHGWFSLKGSPPLQFPVTVTGKSE